MTKRLKLIIVAAIICLSALAVWAFQWQRYWVGPVDRKIVSQIQNTCARVRPCTFTLNGEIDNSPWDTVYVFSNQANQKDVEQVLHTSLHGYREFSGSIALVNKEKLVHFEQEDFDIEKPTPNSLNFDIPDGTNYKSYSRDTLFSVEVERSGIDVYYVLHQWPCKPVKEDKTGKICPLPE